LKALIFTLLLFPLYSFAEVTPTARFYGTVDFSDDLDFQNLGIAIDRQLKSYDEIGLSGTIKFGSKTYPKTILKESLLLLKKLSNQFNECSANFSKEKCSKEFSLAINKNFAIYQPVVPSTQPGYRSRAQTKFTSYYSPDLHGSRVPTERFKNPIYRNPLPPHDNYTRVEIDFNGILSGKGLEVFWVEESFYDLYLLHVQGGGRINIFNPDGTQETKYLSYDGKNAQSFKMIYHYMLEKGYIKPGAAGISHQRKFLSENPDKQEEVFNTCPSYVYFKESSEEPVGLNNIPLTEGRSLAIDSRIYKTMGLINFVKTSRATKINETGEIVKTPFSRFFIAQDTGGAIRGPARCDLYFGYGPQAELTAYNMNEIGEQYFLVKLGLKNL
jgi:membrane-bound lytic murein transglycosylase A